MLECGLNIIALRTLAFDFLRENEILVEPFGLDLELMMKCSHEIHVLELDLVLINLIYMGY